MKKLVTIYEKGDHAWRVVARDPERPSFIIDTNEYLISHDGVALLADPGGQEVFPAVFSAISTDYDPKRIASIFASHQDPDVISSLALWLGFSPELRCYASWLWCSFIPHFGGDAQTMVPVADDGGPIPLGRHALFAVPAHYLHSSGNLHLYDPDAKILFSGDVGAALLPIGEERVFVEDFDQHIRHATGFHKRWMGSTEAKDAWCTRVAKLEVDMLCPQHGAIYRGDDVKRFIDWFHRLEIGVLKRA